MPYISMFFGIIIRMFYNEHNPPHFHAEYQGQKGMFSLEGKLIKGNFTSKTAQKLIMDWAKLHYQELHQNWENAKQHTQLEKIEPLN